MTKNNCLKCKWFLQKGSLCACRNKKVIQQAGLDESFEYIAFASNSAKGSHKLPKNCKHFQKD